MINLILKELKLNVHPFFYVLPFITGALMLVPAWLYFVVFLYFCFFTIPNMFAGYKTQNDLVFVTMLPVTRNDIVKARVTVIVLLELLHMVAAVFYGALSLRLYPNLVSYFLRPSIGFWGLSFVMLAVFNIVFIPMYYKTAYQYGAPAVAAITAAILFAGGAEWLAIRNPVVYDLFKGAGAGDATAHLAILVIGIAIFALFNVIACRIAILRYAKVEV